MYSDRLFLYFTVYGPLQTTGKSRDKRVTIQATRMSICGTQVLGIIYLPFHSLAVPTALSAAKYPFLRPLEELGQWEVPT